MNTDGHQVADPDRLARLEARLADVEAKLEHAEALYLRFMGGAGRRLLRMLGADVTDLSP